MAGAMSSDAMQEVYRSACNEHVLILRRQSPPPYTDLQLPPSYVRIM